MKMLQRRTEPRKKKSTVMYSEKTYLTKIVNVADKAVVASVQEANFTQKSLHLHDFTKVEEKKIIIEGNTNTSRGAVTCPK